MNFEEFNKIVPNEIAKGFDNISHERIRIYHYGKDYTISIPSPIAL